MSYRDLPEEICHLIHAHLDILDLQALRMTCKRAYKLLPPFSERVLACLPPHWLKGNGLRDDPCVSYYFPLLYRALREAPPFLYTWSMGTSKKISYGRMTLRLSWSPPHPPGEGYRGFTFWYLSSNQRGWKFSCQSQGWDWVQGKCIELFA